MLIGSRGATSNSSIQRTALCAAADPQPPLDGGLDAMKEKDYYPAVEDWFVTAKRCTRMGSDYKLSGLRLLTGDIVACQGNLVYACELKNYPYPVGSQGWGSIGQALALRDQADFVYVGCVAGDPADRNSASWRRATETRTIRDLLSYLKIEKPDSFLGYLRAAEQVFRHFFGDLGLGLLIVCDYAADVHGYPKSDVLEVVIPCRIRRNAI